MKSSSIEYMFLFVIIVLSVMTNEYRKSLQLHDSTHLTFRLTDYTMQYKFARAKKK